MESLQPAVSLIPLFDYVAACDLVEEKAREATRRFGAREPFSEKVSRMSPEQAVKNTGEALMKVWVEAGLPV